MATKKQPAKKRVYIKKAEKWTKGDTKSARNIKHLEPQIKATNKDTEIESLATICSIFDNWTDEQKRRHLTYLCGRYYDFM